MKKLTMFTSVIVVLLVLLAGTAVVARGGVCHRSGSHSSRMHGMHGNHHRGGDMMEWMHHIHKSLSGWWNDSETDRTHDGSRNNNEGTGTIDSGDSDNVITLRTVSINGMAFQGASEPLTDQINPTITLERGDTLTLQLLNTFGVHDIAIPAIDVQSSKLTRRGARTSVKFVAEETGEFTYYCTIPGHRSAGMEGTMIVE